MSQWLYIGLFFIVGLIIPVGAIAAAWILGPKKPNPIKQTTYECGIETVGESWVQFKAQYYIFALVFLIFDVETVFLFPWAVKLGQLGLFAVIEFAIFCSRTVLPVRGGATMRPRWPKPIGVRMSTARIETSFTTSGSSSRIRFSG